MQKLHYFLLGLAISITACETVVEVDLPQEAPKLVTHAIIQADSTFWILLTQSKPILSQADIQTVSGAEVTLYEEETRVARLEENEENPGTGIYQSSFIPTAGQMYTLRISKQGFESVEATTYIQPAVPIQHLRYDTTQYEYSYYDDSGSLVTGKEINLKEVWLTLNDSPDEDNFYEIQLLQYTTYYQGEEDENGEYIITDTLQRLDPIYLRSNDPVVADNEFFEEDGSFSGSSLVFTDEIFAGKSYTINFEAEGFYSSGNDGDDNKYIVVLRTLNDHFYRYRESVELQRDTEGNPFAEPVPVFNNIEEGYGIFAGFSNDTETILIEE
ncbi:MAG: DUF4249 domain-containing protein [Cyclobacteriaceae bacterium]